MSYSARTPSASAVSTSGFISMYPAPRTPVRLSAICGTCPRGAGVATVLKGAAFSPPE